jgi:hypothetical protein
MLKTCLTGGIAALVLAGTVQGAIAQDAGARSYMEFCAGCHAADASGDGPLSEYISIPVPALTALSGANDGAFPMARVLEVIDGRADIRAHGSIMPTWGSVFKAPLAGEIAPQGAEMAVRGRILSLAYYLESIQE